MTIWDVLKNLAPQLMRMENPSIGTLLGSGSITLTPNEQNTHSTERITATNPLVRIYTPHMVTSM